MSYCDLICSALTTFKFLSATDKLSVSSAETLEETIESGPLFFTDLFQNKYVAYFQSIIISYKFSDPFISFILCNFSVQIFEKF